MKYKITKISPLKAAISVTVIRFVGVSIVIMSAFIMKIMGSSVTTDRPKVENVDPFYDLIGPLLEGTFTIFVSTFIAFFLFNELCHYWGGIEFELSEINISNQKMKADD